MGHQRGFSLLELLIVATIFVIVVLALYALLTQAQWLFLGGEKRVNAQDNARLILEEMERDFRMIGFGVPSGTDVGGATTFTETWNSIFSATVNSIGFTADIDNGNSILSADASTNQIPLHNATYYAGVSVSNTMPILLVNNSNRWADMTAQAISGSTLTTSTNIPSVATFTAPKSEVFTMERVFYRMTGDTNNDGVCNQPYPFCTIEKQEFTTNNPTTEAADANAWQTFGSYVFSLNLSYRDAAGNPITPTTQALRDTIDRIEITVTCRERDIQAGQYQDTTLKSEVVLRNRVI